MSEMYDQLAPIYDTLNGEIDYETWADALVSNMKQHAKREIKTIADIGCGTGSMTLPLAERGYDMIGVDLSPDMLNVAYQRAFDREEPLSVQFLQQDMQNLAFIAPVDAIVCALDGINHLPGREALQACFASVASWLESGGVFLFDVNSRHKFETVYADEVYTFETEDTFCIWQNEYSPTRRYCDFYITLFDKQSNGTYLRSDSTQREYFYSVKTIENALKKAGLTLVAYAGNLSGDQIKEDDERWYFTAVKG